MNTGTQEQVTLSFSWATALGHCVGPTLPNLSSWGRSGRWAEGPGHPHHETLKDCLFPVSQECHMVLLLEVGGSVHHPLEWGTVVALTSFQGPQASTAGTSTKPLPSQPPITRGTISMEADLPANACPLLSSPRPERGCRVEGLAFTKRALV